MAIFAFDGTTCTPGNLSNVFRMYDAYHSLHKFYATGPGSRGTMPSKLFENITGYGGKERIKDAFEIWKYWQEKEADKKSRETIIVGFSRGAIIAREFANQICENGGKVDFLGLFDSVGSFGNPFDMTDLGYRKSIPAGVLYCAQAMSIHEERFTFRLVRANLAENNTQTNLNESWFPGVHSDIGGTLKEGLGFATLSWMFKQACVENSDQWDDDAMKEAKKNIDCDAEPSKNKITLPASFLNKYRTRKFESDDTKCCE